MDHAHHHNHATSEPITLHVEGMTCAGCANTVTRAIKNKGVQDPQVNYLTGEAVFTPPIGSDVKDIIRGIQDAGYKVQPLKQEKAGRISRVEKYFYFTLPLTLIVFSGHMLLPHDHLLNLPWVQFGISLPVFIAGILFFGPSAWGSVRTGAPNMDVLIMIGAISAFLYSIAGIVLNPGSHEVHRYMFFETGATIITLVLLGNVIEHRSVKQTTGALRELTRLQPQTARKIMRQDGKEILVETELSQVAMGDVLQVNTGDKVPVDGRILAGEAGIDESMITGESVPVYRRIQERVIGGSIVNSGNFRMLAEKVGKETVLARIIELVRNAQQSKPSIQKLGDRVSNIFVPVVVVIALATFLASYLLLSKSLPDSLMNSIAVLVISCPCAMGLATPTAVMVGIGRAARNGILIKGGSSLEELARVRTLVFDKTGTLTTGNFRIRKLEPAGNVPVSELESVLLELEKHSSHPIAVSLVNEMKNKHVQPLKMEQVHEIKGAGMTGKTPEGVEYSAGSFQMAKGKSADPGHSVYILKNGELAGVVDMEDEVKPDAKDTILLLQKMGIRTVLLSGDTENRCREVAEAVGIQTVYSGQRPEQKLEMIDRLGKEGRTAMVGDGVNDAPALARASVGISIGSATQAAIHSAQIVLLSSQHLHPLLAAVRISRATLTTVKQNLFWAFFYNVVAIPVAAAGYLSPVIGALAMAFSDVVVIGNSIRLKFRKLL